MPSFEGAFHRWGGEYLTEKDWPDAPAVRERVRRALGSEPVPDARYLLPPIPLPTAAAPAAPGPRPGIEYVVDVAGATGRDATALQAIFTGPVRRALGLPHLWGRVGSAWVPLEETGAGMMLSAGALSWELTGLLADEIDQAARELARFARDAAHAVEPMGWSASARESSSDGARRAARLIALKRHYSRSVEMRLVPVGRRFPARDVWRAVCALGLVWGDMDVFHWDDAGTRRRLFTLSALGQPAFFLPERAAEGEAIAGLALSFELPTNPAPLLTYDRMAVALDYLRQTLNGRPTASDGAGLDADRLYEDRAALEEAIGDMERAGVAPGSPEAVSFF